MARLEPWSSGIGSNRCANSGTTTALLLMWNDGPCNLHFVIKHLLLVKADALVKWLWEETRVQKVVGSNPGTVYWMDIFSHVVV